MIKNCKVCGNTDELVWRNGKYYCSMCGSEVKKTEPVVEKKPQQSAPVSATVICPICKNAENNTVQDGKCRCALCGTSFEPYEQVSSVQASSKLEDEKNKTLIIAIVLLIFFWPASIYFFYKWYKLNN